MLRLDKNIQDRYRRIELEIIKYYTQIQYCIKQCEMSESPFKSSSALLDINKIKSAMDLLLRDIQAFSNILIELKQTGISDLEERLKIIRHDIYTPIGVIKGYTEILMESMPHDTNDGFFNSLILINDDIKQLAAVVQQIKSYGIIQEKPTVSNQEIEHAAQQNKPADETLHQARTGTILVIDDEELYLTLMQDWLSSRGYKIFTANCAKKGLEILEQHDNAVDVILLDNMMPDISGYDLLKIIKSNPKYTNLSIIMLSGVYEIDRIVKCIKAGAEDYILKPFNSFLLEARINICLERNFLREQNKENKNQLQIITNALPVLICALDSELKFTFNNKSYEIWFNKPVENITGKYLKEFISEENYNIFYENYQKVINSNSPVNFELSLNFQDKSLRHLVVTLTPYIDNEKIKSIFAVMSDITHLKNAEERLQYMATHDMLTGLPNRNLLDSSLDIAIKLSNKTNTSVAVLFIDIDRFKLINDTLGHHYGDQLLIDVSERLKRNLRKDDIIIRMGGDEFVVILYEISGQEEVKNIAAKLCNAIVEPFEINSNVLNISLSIGISQYPNDSKDKHTLLKYADLAMYYVKDHYRNNFKFYTKKLETQTKTKMNILNYLYHALKENEFLIYYQPIVNLSTMNPLAKEALIRWKRPGNGIVKPDDFLPTIEESGFIIELGEWIIRRVCSEYKNWKGSEKNIPISINISSQQLHHPNIVDTIISIIHEEKMDPNLIKFEMTERTLMSDNIEIINKMQRLKDIGIQFFIDDFGKGYSNLSYLSRLPIDGIKIDKSFIQDINIKNEYNDIVSAIIKLAHKINLTVIAEGVENKEQLQFLLDNNCNAAQGYLFSPPMPLENLKTQFPVT